MKQLTPAQLSEWLSDPQRAKPVMLDVREPWEFQLNHINGSLHIPMSSIPARLQDLDPATEIVVICHHGARSYQTARFLELRGYGKLYNLDSGVDGWARTVDPAMPTY